MEKKVSVIIPFFNGVQWLCEAVQSAIDQSYKNIEIIVVNDGSKEDVSDFLKLYGDKIIYRYQENQGSASARNHAINIATGDYYAFLDSDDIWLPVKLEKQISFMEKIGAYWSHTGFYYWYPSTGKTDVIDNFNDYGNVYTKSFVSFRLATPCVVVSRQAIIEHPEIVFPVEFRKAQDTEYFRALSKYYPIALIKEPLAKIRMRKDNSNKQAVMRFNLKAHDYLRFKNDSAVPRGAKCIYGIYYLYSKIFGKESNDFKEKVAYAFWTIPFVLERIYVKSFIRRTPSDKIFLKD